MADDGGFLAAWTATVPDLERLVSIVSAVGRSEVVVPGPRLDELASQLGSAAATGGAGVVGFLVDTLGFRGDDRTYGSPENSRLDRVLERRLGIPLSLSVTAVLLGRRVGVPLEVVGMPHHVLLRDPASGLLHDLFHGGRTMDVAGARAMLARLDPQLPWRPEHLATMTVHQVVDRWCRNLRVASARAGDDTAVDALLAAELGRPDPPPDAVLAAVDRAVRRGALVESATLLERHAPPGEAGRRWRELAARHRARLN